METAPNHPLSTNVTTHLAGCRFPAAHRDAVLSSCWERCRAENLPCFVSQKMPRNCGGNGATPKIIGWLAGGVARD